MAAPEEFCGYSRVIKPAAIQSRDGDPYYIKENCPETEVSAVD